MTRDYFNALYKSSKHGVGPTCLNIIIAYKTVKTKWARKTERSYCACLVFLLTLPTCGLM